jgi:hypothetical protein
MALHVSVALTWKYRGLHQRKLQSIKFASALMALAEVNSAGALAAARFRWRTRRLGDVAARNDVPQF